MITRIVMSVLFATAMWGLWQWANFITDHRTAVHWELWIPTMLVIFAAAWWFDRHDAKARRSDD